MLRSSWESHPPKILSTQRTLSQLLLCTHPPSAGFQEIAHCKFKSNEMCFGGQIQKSQKQFEHHQWQFKRTAVLTKTRAIRVAAIE
jgi:hypothetical protein